MYTLIITTLTSGSGSTYALIDCTEEGIIHRLDTHSTRYSRILPTRLIMSPWNRLNLIEDINQFLNPEVIKLVINDNPQSLRPLNKKYFLELIEARELNIQDIVMDLLCTYERMNDGLSVNSILSETMSSHLLSELTMSDKDAWDALNGVTSGKFKVIQWPKSQTLIDYSEDYLELDDITLINDSDGLEFYGPTAYLVLVNKLNKYNLN